MLFLNLSNKIDNNGRLNGKSVVRELDEGDILWFRSQYFIGYAPMIIMNGGLHRITSLGEVYEVSGPDDIKLDYVIKTRCGLQYLVSKLKDAASRKQNAIFDAFSYIIWDRELVLEINGKELYPGDYIHVISLQDFQLQIGQYLGRNKVMLITGEIISFQLCEKLDKDDLELQKAYKILNQLSNAALKPVCKKESGIEVGDVYKRGNIVFICLGALGINFWMQNGKYLIMDKRIGVNKLNANYRNQNSEYLWFRVKVSKDDRIFDIVRHFELYNTYSVYYEDFMEIVVDNVGRMEYELDYRSVDIELYRFYNLFYEMKTNKLGNYLGKLVFFGGAWEEYRLNDTPGYTKSMRVVRNSLRFSFIEAKEDEKDEG